MVPVLFVAGTLGVPQAVAAAIVEIILTGSTLYAIIMAITAILSGGISAILTMGWTVFINEVKRRVARYGLANAIAW